MRFSYLYHCSSGENYLQEALPKLDALRDAVVASLGRVDILLNAAGITSTEPTAALASPRLNEVCQPLVVRAQKHFQEADAIMAREPRRTVKAPRIMGAYSGGSGSPINVAGAFANQNQANLANYNAGVESQNSNMQAGAGLAGTAVMAAVIF